MMEIIQPIHIAFFIVCNIVAQALSVVATDTTPPNVLWITNGGDGSGMDVAV